MLRNCILLGLLLASLLGFAQTSKGDKLYNQGKDYLQKKETKKALQSFLNARNEYVKEENFHRALTCTQNVVMYYQDTNNGEAAEKILLETIAAIPQKTTEQLSTHASLQDNLGYTYANVLNHPEKALTCYTESIRLYELINQANTTPYAFELVNRATTYFSLNNFQSASEDMLRAIPIYEKDKETTPSDLARKYRDLGRMYSELSRDAQALEWYQKARVTITDSDDQTLEAMLLNDMGGAYMKLNQLTLALKKYNEALTLNEKVFGKDASHYAMTLLNIATLNKKTGDLDQALKEYQQVLLIYQKKPPEDISNVIDAMTEISSLLDELGMYQQQEVLSQAQNLAITAFGANSLQEADVYIQQAIIAFNHDQFDQSLNYNFKALDVMQQNNYPQNAYYAQVYNNIGLAYDGLKDTDLALKYKNQARDLYAKLRGSDHHTVGMATGNIGLTYEVKGDYVMAIEYLKKSVEIRLKSQPADDDDVGRDYLNIGLMFLKMNEVKDGVSFLEKAKLIYDKYDKNINKARIYNRLSIGYLMLHDLPKAMACNQQAILANTLNFEKSDFDSFPNQADMLSYYESVIAYIAKADIYRIKNDPSGWVRGLQILNEADTILKEKAITFSSAKDRLELATLNSFFTESGMLLASKLFNATHDPAYLNKAFYFSERSKANELLADIQLSRAINLSRISKSVKARKEELSRRMSTLQQQVADAYGAQNQPLITKLKSQELDLSKELEQIQTVMANASPKFKSALSQRSLPFWDDVKKKLDAKTALVSYVITDSAKVILIGNSSGLILKTIPAKTDIERLVRGFVTQLKLQIPEIEPLRTNLTKILWEPVEQALKELGPIENVIILPQGPLSFLPFEALGTDTYLLEKYTISYQLSGALIANQGLSQVNAKPAFIALAPVFEDEETNFVNKSCERFATLLKKTDTTSRAFSLTGQYISPLPATAVEVTSINQQNIDKGLLSKTFLKKEANEELIKRGELQTYDYIHLATHGFVNTQYPELSGLLLAQNKNSDEDGILYTGEILGLTLRAELVTLSACETALGKKIEGEGVRGLTTAFLFAGAHSVISSLWKVADESTSQLMIDFYNQLLSGKNKASALQKAKLNLLKNSKYNHPYYWAPFVLTGAN